MVTYPFQGQPAPPRHKLISIIEINLDFMFRTFSNFPLISPPPQTLHTLYVHKPGVHHPLDPFPHHISLYRPEGRENNSLMYKVIFIYIKTCNAVWMLLTGCYRDHRSWGSPHLNHLTPAGCATVPIFHFHCLLIFILIICLFSAN